MFESSEDLERALIAHGPGALQGSQERRHELARDIVAAGLVRGSFLLASGDPTAYYFDKYRFAGQPTILRRLTNILAPRIPARVDRLVARERGASAIVVALSLESGLPFAILRDLETGGKRAVQGELHRAERVLLVEDIVSTGGAAKGAVEYLRELKTAVTGVLAVVDRMEGAAGTIAAAGSSLDALFCVDELLSNSLNAGGRP
jgi:orotate phosphoribosyltransferase